MKTYFKIENQKVTLLIIGEIVEDKLSEKPTEIGTITDTANLTDGIIYVSDSEITEKTITDLIQGEK